MFEIGVCARREWFEAALAAGAAYVEPVVANDLLVKEGDRWAASPNYVVERKPRSFAVLFPADLRLSDPAFPRESIAGYLAAAMAVIASVGVRGAKVVLGSGPARRIPDAIERSSGEETFANVVRNAQAEAEKHGLRLILEPLQKGETNLLHTIVECAAFLDAHAIEVPIVADLYHMMLEGEDLGVLDRLGPRIGHAHVADTGRSPPGQGDWPIAEFVAALERGGYQGDISIECRWKSFPDEVSDALEFMRSLV